MKNKLIIHHSSLIIGKSFGFTLIELLVAIGIIGILASFLLSNFVGVRQRARDGVRKSDLRQIQSALEFYKSDQSAYPSSLLGCGDALTNDGGATTYMKRIPCDPVSSTPPTNYLYGFSSNAEYCLRACLENTNDGERDEKKYGSNNPGITACGSLSDCPPGAASFTLQNP